MHAYLCYVTQNVKTFKTDESGCLGKDAVKKCAETWKTLSDKDKAPYVATAEEDKKRHDKELEEYKKTGFFTNKDGVHSSKLQVKIKKKKRAAEPEAVVTGKGKVYQTIT